MLATRVIARLDIKGPNVIKGIRFEGLRVIGKPIDLARKYSNAHELLYIDTVASLYGRNQLTTLLEETSDELFIPITVGGGISSFESARRLLNAGADKIAINTAAIRRPDLLAEVSDLLGRQAVTLSIQAKRKGKEYVCYVECGREKTGQSLSSWARNNGAENSVGEILITSIDRDGTLSGPDLDLIRYIGKLDVPLVYSGGIATKEQALECIQAGADAVCIGTAFHYNRLTVEEVDGYLNQSELSSKRCAA